MRQRGNKEERKGQIGDETPEMKRNETKKDIKEKQRNAVETKG